MFEGPRTGDQGRKLFGIAGMIEVVGYGDVKIRCKLPDGKEQEIKLKDVAFVPEARVKVDLDELPDQKGCEHSHREDWCACQA